MGSLMMMRDTGVAVPNLRDQMTQASGVLLKLSRTALTNNSKALE